MKKLILVLLVFMSFAANAQQTDHYQCYAGEIWKWDQLNEKWITTYTADDINYSITVTNTNLITISAKNTTIFRTVNNSERVEKTGTRSILSYEGINITDNYRKCTIMITFDSTKNTVVFQIMYFDEKPYTTLTYLTEIVK